jgi:hypothetical protein
MTKISDCPSCKNFIGFSLEVPLGSPKVFLCKAFPDGIPEEFLRGPETHTTPLPNQVGDFIFKPIDK